MRKISASLALAAIACSASASYFAFSPTAQADHHMKDEKKDGHGHGQMHTDKDIIEVATGPGMTEVSTVVAAIQAADLVETLKGDGPFTVFAPTNAAFAKLPAGTVDTLLKPENKEQLKSILLYHVHAGAAVKAADVKTMKLSTANGADLDVKADGGGVMINNAKVIKTDVVAKNGVIHWVDTVLMPPAK